MPHPEEIDLKIRTAQVWDLEAIVAIYNESIPGRRSTADLDPVRVQDRAGWFAEHEPQTHPIFVAEAGGAVAGWCSISPYRPGRRALRFTAEISYYVAGSFHRQGVASALIRHAVAAAPGLSLKTLFAIVLDRNLASLRLLEKHGFQRWGFLPGVADFDGEECGHLYYGLRLEAQGSRER